MKQHSKPIGIIVTFLILFYAGVSSALMHVSHGKGDALIFPVYYSGLENYYTIHNRSNYWIQGHLRLRGGVWGGEVKSLDIILAPGDSFVFRLANIDVGDRAFNSDADADPSVQVDELELDQSLDPENFAYTGQVEALCGRPVNNPYGADCAKLDFSMVPNAPTSGLSADIIRQHKMSGYIEFIGEAVLKDMSFSLMADLLDPAGSKDINLPYRDTRHAGMGTNAWLWSKAADGFRPCTVRASGSSAGYAEQAGVPCDNGLGDVPAFALSGTAFLTLPGRSSGIAYNAVAIENFRSASGHGTHRIDNYRADAAYNSLDTVNQAANSAVILHEDMDAVWNQTAPRGDYVYGIGDKRIDEARISYAGRWGPTLADGDDYSDILCSKGLRFCDISGVFDDWEGNLVVDAHSLPPVPPSTGNSIAEVEEALRGSLRGNLSEAAAIPGGYQLFSTYSFAGTGLSGAPLQTYYLALFPTKYFYVEDPARLELPEITGADNPVAAYAADRAGVMVNQRVKPMEFELEGYYYRCASHCLGNALLIADRSLELFDVAHLKQIIGSEVDGFNRGNVMLRPSYEANDPIYYHDRAWPMLMYAFEVGGADLIENWREMHR